MCWHSLTRGIWESGLLNMYNYLSLYHGTIIWAFHIFTLLCKGCEKSMMRNYIVQIEKSKVNLVRRSRFKKVIKKLHVHEHSGENINRNDCNNLFSALTSLWRMLRRKFAHRTPNESIKTPIIKSLSLLLIHCCSPFYEFPELKKIYIAKFLKEIIQELNLFSDPEFSKQQLPVPRMIRP